MTSKTKKIVAKEIIILFSTIIVIFIAIGSIYLVYHFKINSINDSIAGINRWSEKELDEFLISKNLVAPKYLNKDSLQIALKKMKAEKKRDSLEIANKKKGKLTWDFDFSFLDYKLDQYVTSVPEKRGKAEMYFNYQRPKYNKYVEHMYLSSLIIFIAIYPLRMIIHLLHWSIKTQKE